MSAIDSEGRTIFVADAHRDDGKRFIVRADEKLAAFLELEAPICAREEPDKSGVMGDCAESFSICSGDAPVK